VFDGAHIGHLILPDGSQVCGGWTVSELELIGAARENTERPEERLRGALNAVCRAYHDMAHTPSRSYDHCIEVMCANVRQLLRDTERPDSACTCLIKAPPGSFEHVPDCPAAEQEHEG
jgi:hypothetical protein